MRISDWSSDVCSSDLPESGEFPDTPLNIRAIGIFNRLLDTGWFRLEKYGIEKTVNMAPVVGQLLTQLIGRSEERRVGKSVSVRVDLGGRRSIKKNKNINNKARCDKKP